MELTKALRLTRQTRLALVGAGGKTTAMFQLARQNPPPVILTATTHLSKDQLGFADHHFIVQSPEEVRKIVPVEGVILFTGQTKNDGRTLGVGQETIEEIHRLADQLNCPLIIEADGSRQRPLKAPADHEPVIPDFVDTVVVTAGLSGLGKPLTSDWVHRPERFAELTGLDLGIPVSVYALVNLLTHPSGGQKNIPSHARRLVLLNQADTVALQSQARGMVDDLLSEFHGIGIGSLKHEKVYAMHERIAGVVLAAGASKRLGQPKQLLDWHGKPLVQVAADVALEAGLSPVVIVTGAYGDEVKQAINGPVVIANNPEWEFGQSTSVKRGLAELPLEIGGAVFFLVDQPFVSVPLVRALVEEHTRTLAPIVAPLIDEQRGNPVLFDRVTFQDFEGLEGDVGARPLFARYRPFWVPWHDARALGDVDTMEDYQRLFENK